MILVPLAIPPEPPVAKSSAAQRCGVGKGAPVLRGGANPCPRAPTCDPLNSTGGSAGWRPSCWCDLPIGTRGGMSRSYTFAQDGEYEIQVSLMRDLAGIVSGLRELRTHELLVLIDREPVHTFTISKAAIGNETLNEKPLKAHISVKAGPHNLAVTFVKDGSSLVDTARHNWEDRL